MRLPFRKTIYHAAMVAACAVAIAGSAQGQDRLAGESPSSFEATFKGLYTHDNNLFTTRNKKSDDYYTLFLGLDGTLSRTGVELGIGGEVRDKHYDHFSSQDDTEYDLNGRAVFGGTNVFTLGFYGTAIHDIAPVDATNVTRVESDTSSGWATFTLVPSDILRIELTAGVEDKIYKKFDALEYFKNFGSISLVNQATEKTALGVKYYVADQDWDDNVRYDFVQTRITAFVDHAITEKMTSHVELGVESVDYDTDKGVITDRDDASDEFFAAIDLRYVLTPKVEYYANLNRQVNQSSSATSNYYLEHAATLGAIYKPTDKLTIDLSGRYSDIDENRTFDSKTTGGAATITYVLRDQLSIEATVDYTDRDSDSPSGDYDRCIGTVGFVLVW